MSRELTMIDTEGIESFIPERAIAETLASRPATDPGAFRAVLDKALDKRRLDPEDVALLIRAEAPEHVEALFAAARELKQRVYGNRIVLFAPLYIGNDCVNNCVYCGFRNANRSVTRRTLTFSELSAEVEALVNVGHKRLILVYGEHPDYDARFIHDTVRHVYARKHGNGAIRRVNVNAAPLDTEGFKLVREAGIGTYQIFQESYHQPTYAAAHPSGPKQRYLWRLHALSRAMEAGLDDVGIGALFGLYDWRFEVMGLLYHTIHLEERFGVGPHTISFPRIEPAVGSAFTLAPPHAVSDADFLRLIAIIRLAVPYTGLILTCRESSAIRQEGLKLGVSQIDGGSNIGIGAYSEKPDDVFSRSQFALADRRSLDTVVRELCETRHIPSFCTGCYRLGRTGEHFMEFAVPGFVKRFCTPNAVLTFLEYLEDYASPETRAVGLEQIERELEAMPDGAAKRELAERMSAIRSGARDLYF